MRSHHHNSVETSDKKGGVWLAVMSLALGSFASVTTEFLPVGLLPDVASTFGISSGQAGLMMTLPGLFAALAAPGIMMAAGRTDRKVLMLALTLVLLGSAILSSWAPSFTVMLIARAMTGISLGAFWALSLAVAGKLVKSEDAPRAVAAVFAGVTTAMILGVPLGTFIGGLFSWRVAFLAASALAAAALVMQMIFLPRVPAGERLRPFELLRFVRQKPARKTILLIALLFGTHFGTYTYLAPILSEIGINSFVVTWSLLGFGVAGFFSNFVASAFVEKKLRTAMATATVLMLCAVVSLGLTNCAAVAIGAVLVWGAAWGAMPLCLNMANRTVSEENTEAGSAMFTFVAQAAIAAGSSAGGVVVDMAGVPADFYAGAALMTFSVFILYMWQSQVVKNARR
ncbi:MFS transporter [Erwinia aphidicola]|uniref:MFS transporter n=1 Tax=Erwinia aphidicola TaxID=68334 RepID=UPI003D212A90